MHVPPQSRRDAGRDRNVHTEGRRSNVQKSVAPSVSIGTSAGTQQLRHHSARDQVRRHRIAGGIVSTSTCGIPVRESWFRVFCSVRAKARFGPGSEDRIGHRLADRGYPNCLMAERSIGDFFGEKQSFGKTPNAGFQKTSIHTVIWQQIVGRFVLQRSLQHASAC